MRLESFVLPKPPSSLRQLVRLLAICRTLARYDLIRPLPLWEAAPWFLRLTRLFTNSRQRDRPLGQRLSAALQELGPAFIKFGQTLATRADLVGDDVAAALAGLQDRLPPFAAAQARAAIESGLGRPVEALFESFDERPLAAASIAQVHLAVTASGEPVAVKILRPGIEAQFARDLALFAWLARLFERWVPSLRRLRPQEVVRTLARSVTFEMDLRFEAAAASELADNFAGDASFRVPRIDWERTGKRVLTLARVDGLRIDDRAALIEAGQDLRTVLTNAASAFFNQVFRDGFFHADMHPGNLFVAPDGGIVAVDFGIMGRLDLGTRYFLADMLVGFLSGDYRRVAEVHFAAGYVPADQSIESFTQACRSIGEPLLGKPLADISLGRLLAQLFEVTETFQMETQPQLLLLQKSMLVAEGIGRNLDPTVNMWELARPLIEDWVRENRGPEARLKQLVGGSVRTIERLPHLAGRLIDLLERGEKSVVHLHADTVEALAEAIARRRLLPWALLWLAILILAIMALS
jgi:ubiquinone biosynthesis protein